MFKGWWIVATHFLVMFFATGFYQYGLSAVVPLVIEEFETDAVTINALFSIHVAVGLVAGPVAGPLVDRWSARGILLIGVTALVAGIVVLSIAPTAWTFVIAGGLALGVSGTLCGPMAGGAVVARFFTASRGRAMGITSIGTSVGGAVIPLFIGAAVVALGWRPTLQVVAVAVAVVCGPLLVFRFWDHPEDAGVEAEPMPAGAPLAGSDDQPPMTAGEVVARPAFWLFSLSLALFIAVYTSTVFNLGKYYDDLGIPEADWGKLIAALAIGGVIGKLSFGALADRVPLKAAYLTAIALTAGSLVALMAKPGFGLLVPVAAILGTATGGLLPVWNALVPRLFGVANFGRTMGLMGPVISLVTIPVYPLVGAVRDATGSYTAVFQGHLVALGVAAFVALFLRERPANGD